MIAIYWIGRIPNGKNYRRMYKTFINWQDSEMLWRKMITSPISSIHCMECTITSIGMYMMPVCFIVLMYVLLYYNCIVSFYCYCCARHNGWIQYPGFEGDEFIDFSISRLFELNWSDLDTMASFVLERQDFIIWYDSNLPRKGSEQRICQPSCINNNNNNNDTHLYSALS